MSKRNIIRVNDRVKIVNPITIERWGYTLTKKIVKETLITKEHKQAIYTMLRVIDGTPTTQVDFDGDLFSSNSVDYQYEKVLDIIAWRILQNKRYGGPERKLFTTERESLRNKEGVVVDRKVVKTGRYCAPSAYSGWTDYGYEYDWEPGGLADEETHVLFKVNIFSGQEGVCQNINNSDTSYYLFDTKSGVWIEKINLEKVKESYDAFEQHTLQTT